ncbi:hypothetical protein [Listeria ilorinensis]|uniref:hypothetical protein n=1 Tax=Listeria ilorinensis TaxID=2867439 RepID=UPI001EF46E44|nr:hypothetical protein [Listeria ilorinensis]
MLADEEYQAIKAGEPLEEKTIKYPRINYSVETFTPFTIGTTDYEEWQGDLDFDGQNDRERLRQIVSSESLEFCYVGYTEAFPNYYFVALDDPHPENPTVYSTDHEVFFQEIDESGTFLDFLHLLVSEQEFEQTLLKVKQALKNE